MSEEYELTLSVGSASDRSTRAIAAAKQLCDTHLGGRCRLSVIDLWEDLAAVMSSAVISAPTLIKHGPLPSRRVVGDLSDAAKVLRALQLPLGAVAPQRWAG